jgi:hypothetical protein
MPESKIGDLKSKISYPLSKGWTTSRFGSVDAQNLKPAQSIGGKMQPNPDPFWASVQAGPGQTDGL